MSDLILSTTQVVDPIAGELLDLKELPTGRLAATRLRIKQWEAAELREVKDAIDAELTSRVRAENVKTLHVEGGLEIKVVSQSPKATDVYDAIPLKATLDAFVEEGLITRAAADRAVKTEVTYKPVVNELKKMKGLSDDIRERIEAHEKPVEIRQYLSVKEAV